jgi:hypothetical protein
VTNPPPKEQNGSSSPKKPVSPVASSACWWTSLFLVLAALTVENLSSAPAQLRAVVTVIAAGLLGAGFFVNFARKPAPGTYVGLRRFNTVMLWLAVAAVALFALLPRANP